MLLSYPFISQLILPFLNIQEYWGKKEKKQKKN